MLRAFINLYMILKYLILMIYPISPNHFDLAQSPASIIGLKGQLQRVSANLL